MSASDLPAAFCCAYHALAPSWTNRVMSAWLSVSP